LLKSLAVEEGLVGFDLMVPLATSLLRASPTVRHAIGCRYPFVIIDEFQDTDPLQAEVVFFLSEKPGRFAANWQDVELDEGKLFLVGDPKQSIYRFRRADLDLYGRVREKISCEGEVLVIRANFRSEPGLISEVNALFSELMMGHPNRYEPEYADMEPHRPSRYSSPRVHALPPPSTLLHEGIASAELSTAEAACVAEYIRRLVLSPDHLDNRNSDSAVSFRDIAVLYPTTSHLAELEAALRSRDIPFEVTGERDLARRVEIQALRVVLAAIDNPHDGVSVIGAIRSPFFACSDEELLRHRLHGGHFDYTSATSSEPHLERSFALLRRFHDYRCHRTPSEILTLLFKETTGLQVFALKPRGGNRVANLLKILDLARALEASGSFSFHRLVQWLERLEELRLGEDESITEEDTDAVRLMTFHKAKGLEFPVVILFHLRHDFTKNRSPVVIDRTRKSIELRIPAGETTGYVVAADDDSDRQRNESLRQLYVAMTRARDLLVLPLGWISPEARSSPRWLHDVLASRYPTAPTTELETSNDGFTVIDTSSLDLSVSVQESLVIELVGIEESVATAARKHRQIWTTRQRVAVNLLDHTGTFIRPSAHAPVRVPAQNTSARIAETDVAQFGLFVHRLLERVALPGGEDLDELISGTAEEFSVSAPDRATGAELVRRALASDLFTSRLPHARRCVRELTFSACLNDRIIEGTSDLAFREDDGWIIVDFKTDAVSPFECTVRAKHYQHQLIAYAQALSSVTGEEVAEVILYFLRPDVRISFKPKDWS
ncbi:UvrD-helicase domain-containing protein, partial [bacterium]|nr:UvrD-helicase domain-containing protein [bacterium]